MHIAIIGGGAAGFAAAIAAAGGGARVTVLERNGKPLKKLGVTGNGRGNIFNVGEPAYYGDTAFAKAVLERVNTAALRRFFADLGVPLRQEGEGRVYPAALQASAVQEALRLRAAQLGIAVLCAVRIEHIVREPAGFTLRGRQAEEPFALAADRVIVACGGAAAPAHGTDGTAYELLTALGHTCTPLYPALCALKVPKKRIQGLAGQRVRAALTLTDAQGRPVHRTHGEALFGDDAVSGIASMQLARFVRSGMELQVDLRDELNIGTEVLPFVRSLAAMRPGQPAVDLLTGAFARPVSRWILREAEIKDLQTPIHALQAAQLCRLADTVADIRLPVLGTRGFDAAQVTAGGIETEEFDPETMESRLVLGLYAAGEILNVDGDCGGFNLMFAFASGSIAGERAAHAAK